MPCRKKTSQHFQLASMARTPLNVKVLAPMLNAIADQAVLSSREQRNEATIQSLDEAMDEASLIL